MIFKDTETIYIVGNRSHWVAFRDLSLAEKYLGECVSGSNGIKLQEIELVLSEENLQEMNEEDL